jgi:hypothetical protein
MNDLEMESGEAAWSCATHHIKAAKPILINVANWFRWRKLAKASPIPGLLTQMPNGAVAPKYCNKPSTALSSAAVNQAVAATFAKGTRAAHNKTRAKHPSDSSQGITDGDGPGENGLSQGRMRKTKTAIVGSGAAHSLVLDLVIN